MLNGGSRALTSPFAILPWPGVAPPATVLHPELEIGKTQDRLSVETEFGSSKLTKWITLKLSSISLLFYLFVTKTLVKNMAMVLLAGLF